MASTAKPLSTVVSPSIHDKTTWPPMDELRDEVRSLKDDLAAVLAAISSLDKKINELKG